MRIKGVEFGAETATTWGSCLHFELSRCPILTTCGLSVRKSRFQLQSQDAKVRQFLIQLAIVDNVGRRTVILEKHCSIPSAAVQGLQSVVYRCCYRIVH